MDCCTFFSGNIRISTRNAISITREHHLYTLHHTVRARNVPKRFSISKKIPFLASQNECNYFRFASAIAYKHKSAVFIIYVI